jgi:hypothetical protein
MIFKLLLSHLINWGNWKREVMSKHQIQLARLTGNDQNDHYGPAFFFRRFAAWVGGGWVPGVFTPG